MSKSSISCKKEAFCFDSLYMIKFGLYYSMLFLSSGLFFVGLILVFSLTVNSKTPTYYNSDSVMATHKSNSNKIANPGMGFRPQLNPDSSLIYYSINENENRTKELIDSIKTYLRFVFYNIFSLK